MPISYASSPSDLKHTALPDEAMLSIGKIIRAAAEIEDIIGFFIAAVARVSESTLTILLARAPITRKLQIAQYLAAANGGEANALFKANVGAELTEFLNTRNAVAHGVLLGQSVDDDRYVFLTSKTESPDNSATTLVAAGYRLWDLAEAAKWGENMVVILERNLKLASLRRERLSRPLLPHRKGRKPRTPSAGHKPPLQSSQG